MIIEERRCFKNNIYQLLRKISGWVVSFDNPYIKGFFEHDYNQAILMAEDAINNYELVAKDHDAVINFTIGPINYSIHRLKERIYLKSNNSCAICEWDFTIDKSINHIKKFAVEHARGLIEDWATEVIEFERKLNESN